MLVSQTNEACRHDAAMNNRNRCGITSSRQCQATGPILSLRRPACSLDCYTWAHDTASSTGIGASMHNMTMVEGGGPPNCGETPTAGCLSHCNRPQLRQQPPQLAQRGGLCGQRAVERALHALHDGREIHVGSAHAQPLRVQRLKRQAVHLCARKAFSQSPCTWHALTAASWSAAF